MADAQLRVDGARQLRTSMRRAGIDMRELRETHAEAARLVAARADPPRRTGRLAATIRAAGTQTQAVVRAGYARVPYAPVIHWGWPARGIRAQPFLTEAAQASEPAWVELYTRHVEQILNTIEGATSP